MRKIVVIVLVVAVAVGAAAYFGLFSRERAAAAAGQAGGPGQARQGGGGGGFGGMGGGFRGPITVEVGRATRGPIAQHLTAVGNLIGQATVEIVPKTGGRLVSVNVKLGDRVTRGQLIAKVEDREIVEQVRQAEASHEVAQATIRQREADLTLAKTSVERSRNLFGRQLLPRQTLDDSEARYQAAIAQLDLARAQLTQNDARLEELKINLANTSVIAPVTGFVAKRYMDPGAWVSQQAPVASVVDISSLRLVVNVVERDLRVVTVGDAASVEVDAYPGEKFAGRIARVAPVLDPATRTAEMEVEVSNQDNRLKPGMYARIILTIDERSSALTIPRPALVDFESKRGVWIPAADGKVQFVPVELGIEASDRVEILSGLKEGDTVVVTGATALRPSDTITAVGQDGPSSGPSALGAGSGQGGSEGRPMGGRRPGGTGQPGQGR
jgi:RND family efflux transporter MFP subunit